MNQRHDSNAAGRASDLLELTYRSKRYSESPCQQHPVKCADSSTTEQSATALGLLFACYALNVE